MKTIKIDKERNIFTKDGKPFFYLADTIWSAFTNITLEEWKYYLRKRRMQGFNTLQINTLPQWDRCMSDVGYYPFETKDGQTFDFDHWNETYYERARRMCDMAVKEGFQLALVVLWLNYVPGTWGSRINEKNVMPEHFVAEYTKKVIEEFDEYNPIYVVSGDTDFDTPEAISYYKKALDVICEKSPDSLKTFHIKRGYDIIPEEFVDKMDFYMFQSGHNNGEQSMAYILPQNFLAKYPRKPMINAEPCYEQMGYSREPYGRFTEKEIRSAAWTSILSGASAGVTYGAHGIWNWNKLVCPTNPVLGEGFDKPFLWQEAIEFPGAWDYGLLKSVIEEKQAWDFVPSNHLLNNPTEKIRVAKAGDMFFIYMKNNTNVRINELLDGYEAVAVDLQDKRKALLNIEVKETESIIEMHPFSNDVLLMVAKK